MRGAEKAFAGPRARLGAAAAIVAALAGAGAGCESVEIGRTRSVAAADLEGEGWKLHDASSWGYAMLAPDGAPGWTRTGDGNARRGWASGGTEVGAISELLKTDTKALSPAEQDRSCDEAIDAAATALGLEEFEGGRSPKPSRGAPGRLASGTARRDGKSVRATLRAVLNGTVRHVQYVVRAPGEGLEDREVHQLLDSFRMTVPPFGEPLRQPGKG